MVTLSRKTLVLICIGCLLAGVAYTNVEIRPKNDRPVLKALARAAKAALWFMAFAEPPPKEDEQHHVQSVLIDEQGYAHINHSRGW